MIYNYSLLKHYLIYHSVNDSIPMPPIDRTNNSSVICLVGDVLLDVQFNDEIRKIIVHQVFQVKYNDGLIELVPVEMETDDFMELLK